MEGSPDVSSFERLGPWRLERPLGSGGMGTVWLADRADGAFRMKAAVKLINRDALSPQQIQRFVRERQILADLEHANICRLIDGGTTADERPYLVMELVDGLPLDQYVRQAEPSVPALLRLMIKICDAVGFAHARGVIHRDLKPGNIMVNESGEPKVLDFGIARLRSSTDPKITQTGQMALTPCYASPEQWRGEQLGPGADVFSLGIVLFELLTQASLPAPGLQGVPESSMIEAGLDDALREIVLRAVHDQAEHRFVSMAELAEALRTYLEGVSAPEAIASRPTRVFISCRSDVTADFELALSFYNALAEAGASVFLAPKHATSHTGWVEAVTQAMSSSDVLLLLLSPQAAVSEMVAREIELAQRLNEDRDEPLRIVPVRVCLSEFDTSSDPVHEYLQTLDDVSWRGTDDTSAVVDLALGRAQSKTNSKQLPTDPAASTALRTRPPHSHSSPREDPAASRAHLSLLEFPGGVVSPDSPYYVARPQFEEACLAEIVKRGALIRIKGSRQMGKTSLMNRLLSHAAHTGARTISISLQLTDNTILADIDRFLRWLCAAVGRRLRLLTPALDEEWDDLFGAKDNCTAYFEDHILSDGEPLVLAIDHIDRVFDYPNTAEEFLSLLRAWNEMGKSQNPWPALRLVLAYATEMYLPMNINRSPFNVGLPVALSEWDTTVIRDLAERHNLSLKDADLRRLIDILGGHPHLTRIALHHLAGGLSLDELLDHAATDDGIFADHLKSLQWHIQANPLLRDAAIQVMNSDRPVQLSSELGFKLTSLGLARLRGNELVVSRELYRRYLIRRI
ncbi:MAG: AAA-like domain-containing protein [Myxococcota bacterium]